MKQEIDKLGLSLTEIAQQIGCSRPMLSRIINHGEWPKKNAVQLRESLSNFFKENGADIPVRLLQPQDVAPLAQTQQVSEDENMLLRKATLTQEARKTFGLFKDPFNEEVHSADDVFTTPDI